MTLSSIQADKRGQTVSIVYFEVISKFLKPLAAFSSKYSYLRYW